MRCPTSGSIRMLQQILTANSTLLNDIIHFVVNTIYISSINCQSECVVCIFQTTLVISYTFNFLTTCNTFNQFVVRIVSQHPRSILNRVQVYIDECSIITTILQTKYLQIKANRRKHPKQAKTSLKPPKNGDFPLSLSQLIFPCYI